MKRGYIHVYTGNGKGKTTASLGLALRASGAGLAVQVIQFIKSMEYNEIKTLKKLDIPVHQFGRGCFIMGEPSPEDRQEASRGLEFIRSLYQKKPDILILDEINVALDLKLFDVEEVINLLLSRPEGTEIVCTGRGAPKKLLDIADLVTEMVCVRHYYDSGVQARNGIEK